MSTKMTKQDRIMMERLRYHTWILEGDDWDASSALNHLVPSAWHTLMADIDCHEPKEKVTLYLDKSVARTFKAMGKGYQARINRLLQTWLAMKMAGNFDTYQALRKHQAEWQGRRQKMEAEGQAVPLGYGPGDLPPTSEPPDVDW